MKKILIIALLGLLAANMNCGGGGGTSYTAATTSLTINLGEVREASSLSASEGSVVGTSSIPSPVASIRITISGPDMATIQEIIPTAGLTSISVTIEVPTGPNRHILVEALNATGGVLYRGETYVDLDGTPVSVPIVMVSADPVPPVFAGLSSITSVTHTSMVLSWSPATDNVTPQDKIQYLIYMATTSGGENFSVPSFTTTLGATMFTLTGLTPETTYCFVVRAMDEVGNIETNTIEFCAATTQYLSISPTTVTITALPNIDPSESDDVTFTIQGGVPPYNVTSSNPSIIPDPGEISALSSSVLSSMQTGTFTIDPDQDCSTTLVTLTVTDSMSESVEATVNLTIPAFSATLGNDSICESGNTCSAGTDTTTLTLTGVPPFDVTSSEPTVIPNPGMSWTDTYTIDAIDHSINADTLVDLSSSSYCDAGPQVSSVTVINQIDIDLQLTNHGIDTLNDWIYCDVVNAGSDDAMNVEVWFDYDDGCVSTNCDQITPVDVPGGSTLPVTYSYAFIPVYYRIIVDPQNLIQESDETNNCVTNNPGMCSLPIPDPGDCSGM